MASRVAKRPCGASHIDMETETVVIPDSDSEGSESGQASSGSNSNDDFDQVISLLSDSDSDDPSDRSDKSVSSGKNELFCFDKFYILFTFHLLTAQTSMTPRTSTSSTVSLRAVDKSYASKGNLLAPWSVCRILYKISGTSSTNSYCVQFEGPDELVKKVPAYHVAKFEPPITMLRITTRVIAKRKSELFLRKNKSSAKQTLHDSQFFAGTIGETIHINNGYRYLIFFDDGHVQYVAPAHVRVILTGDMRIDNFWGHVHLNARAFLKYRFENEDKRYPQLAENEGCRLKVESNGEWLFSEVIGVDGTSLVQILYEDTQRTEWFFRGSPRLGKRHSQTIQRLIEFCCVD